MIEVKKGYDSALDSRTCDWCKGIVEAEAAKVLYGTGNSLLAIYHPECDKRMRVARSWELE